MKGFVKIVSQSKTCTCLAQSHGPYCQSAASPLLVICNSYTSIALDQCSSYVVYSIRVWCQTEGPIACVQVHWAAHAIRTAGVTAVTSVKIGTIQRRLAWPSRRDDTHKSRISLYCMYDCACANAANICCVCTALQQGTHMLQGFSPVSTNN